MATVGGQQVFTGALVSTVSATAVPLSSSALIVRSIVIQADPSNTGSIAIGDSAVTLTTGMVLGPGDSMTLAAENDSRYNDFDLAEVYAYSGTTGNKLRLMGFKRRV